MLKHLEYLNKANWVEAARLSATFAETAHQAALKEQLERLERVCLQMPVANAALKAGTLPGVELLNELTLLIDSTLEGRQIPPRLAGVWLLLMVLYPHLQAVYAEGAGDVTGLLKPRPAHYWRTRELGSFYQWRGALAQKKPSQVMLFKVAQGAQHFIKSSERIVKHDGKGALTALQLGYSQLESVYGQLFKEDQDWLASVTAELEFSAACLITPNS